MKNILLFFACCTALLASPALRADCASVVAEIQTAEGQRAKDAQLLDANQKAMAGLAATDTTKRIKISSNMMILTARIETGQNTKQIKIQECKKQGCPSCPMI
jgi:hypothetical protein